MGSTNAQRRTFTLIELLVVISIIAILASMLLPSLGRAKEKAKATCCMGNLCQLGKGLFMYSDDWGEHFPAEFICSNPQPTLCRCMETYVPCRHVFYCPSADAFEPGARSTAFAGPADSVINTDANWAASNITYKYFSFTNPDLRLQNFPPRVLSTKDDPSRWLMSGWFRRACPIWPHCRRKGDEGGGVLVMRLDTSVNLVTGKPKQSYQ